MTKTELIAMCERSHAGSLLIFELSKLAEDPYCPAFAYFYPLAHPAKVIYAWQRRKDNHPRESVIDFFPAAEFQRLALLGHHSHHTQRLDMGNFHKSGYIVTDLDTLAVLSRAYLELQTVYSFGVIPHERR